MITTINEFKNQLNENNAYDYYWSQFHARIWKSPISGWKWSIKSVNNDYYDFQSDIDANLQTAIDAEMDMIDFCEKNIGSKPEVQINENHMIHIGSLNLPKDNLFKKSTFSPSFQSIIYGALRDILPQSYKIDIKKFGDKNTISIIDFNNKRYAFRVDDNTSIAKILKMIKAKMKITESIENPIDSEYFCRALLMHAKDLESEDPQLAKDLERLGYSVKTFYPNKDISIQNVYSTAYEINLTNQNTLNEVEIIWDAI